MDASTLLTQLTEAQRNPAEMLAKVEALAQDDPAARAVLEILRQRQAAADVSPKPETRAGDDARYRRLREAYDGLYALVVELAQALGACPRCWGEGAECTLCDGRGAPGSSEPHWPSFDRFVLPAVHAVPTARSLNGTGRNQTSFLITDSLPAEEN